MNRVLIFFFLIFSTVSFGQPSQLGLVCDSAVAICNINNLNGFEGTLPSNLEFPAQQPVKLCSSGGTVNNIYWFSFVAGSDSISLTITPSNCTDSTGMNQGNAGIQGGVYASCEFDMEVLCEIGVGNLDPITLSSGNFVPGQTYYFWVDGYGGDICDFKVNVNFASQPFALPEVISFDQGNLTDTLCLGYLKDTISIYNYPLDVDFLWNVTSTNPAFVPLQIKNLKKFIKLDYLLEGTYTVSLQATNGCDSTEIISKKIVIQPIPNEVFDTAFICSNRFPFGGPQTQDPNGDGIIGWLGPNINSPGQTVYNVFQANGCKYSQTIEVEELPISQRENVTIVDCQPFDYHGTMVFTDLINVPITLSNLASNGCDSLVNLTSYLLDVSGNLIFGNCNNANLTIQFNPSQISAPGGYTIAYFWRWADGTVITDNDNVPSDITVSMNGEVYLSVELSYLGKTCRFDIPSILVDLNNLRPEAPTPVDWDLDICSNDLMGTYTVSPVSGASSYNWILPQGAAIVTGAGTNQVSIDFTNATSYTLCVTAVNSCGEGPQSCLPIKIIPLPDPSFDFPGTSCTDSILVLQANTVRAGASYSWNISNNNLVNGSLNSPGQILLKIT